MSSIPLDGFPKKIVRGDFLLAIGYGQQPSRFVSFCSSKTQNETVRVAADELITQIVMG